MRHFLRRPSSVLRRSSFFLLPSSFILLFFWKLAFTHLILARGDAFLYFYPYWDARARALLAGQLPLWNPYLFMGAPFLANPQAGVLYPLNWPLIFFPAPVAIKISILTHLLIAALGAHLFARRALGQSLLGALLSALLFSLGGYLTSQVEHVNQLQGLAWFPWLLFSVHQSITNSQANKPTLYPPLSTFHLPPATFHFPPATFYLLSCAILFAFQLLAGHTQSAFISLFGAGLYAVSLLITQHRSLPQPSLHQANFRHSSFVTRSRSLRPLGCGHAQSKIPFRVRSFVTFILHPLSFILLALLLASAQLLPAFELSQQSLRSGGLPVREALSFSLDPRLLGRALLPGYSRGLFSEFVAYLGVVGLALAAFGIKKTPQRLALLVLVGLGLTFALGVYNPLYALLATLPPFNLFRVPARWLFLFAFGGALLAGHGLDDLSQRRLGIWPLGVGIFLIFLTPLANDLIPSGETGPLGAPTVRDLAGWLLPLVLLAALTLIRLPERWRAFGIFLLATLELFCAAQILPYNHLTTPEAYTSVRPAMTQLLASTSSATSVTQSVAASVDSRFISMSALRFDPGDLAELHSELDSQLPPDAVYDAIVATKNKEVLSPNLPLAWNVPAVDGYDGGLLPLKNYADFTQLFTGAVSADGRLRENLATAPDARLLSLVNARYLITDKVDDAWIEDVFYDLQFTLTLAEGEQSTIAYLPKFQATALSLVADSFSGHIRLTFTEGISTDFSSSVYRPAQRSSVFSFNHPSTPTSITLTGPLSVRGLSLIDERSGAFQSLTLGPYRLVHSGDVKIYDNLSVFPRAIVVPEAVVITDNAAALTTLADPNFDPASVVILSSAPTAEARNQKPEVRSDPLRPPSREVEAFGLQGAVLRPATITFYSSEHLRLTAEGPGYLLLTDAYYPGWIATVDDAPIPILRADIMFRAVELPAGSHVVEFRFEPRSVEAGLVISGVTWAIVLISLILLAIRNKKAGALGVGFIETPLA